MFDYMDVREDESAGGMVMACAEGRVGGFESCGSCYSPIENPPTKKNPCPVDIPATPLIPAS